MLALQSLDQLDDVIDLLLRRTGFHDDDHVQLPKVKPLTTVNGQRTTKKKGSPGEIDAEAPYECGCTDGSPSAVIETATSGYHYTLNHLLPLGCPCQATGDQCQPPASSSHAAPR